MKKQEKVAFNQKKTNPVNSRSTDDLDVRIIRQGHLYFVMEFRGKEGAKMGEKRENFDREMETLKNILKKNSSGNLRIRKKLKLNRLSLHRLYRKLGTLEKKT